MKTRRPWIPFFATTAGALAFAILAGAGAASAAFIVIDDFDGLLPGAIDGQNGWVAPSDNSAVVADPAGGDNQVLAVVTESTHLRREALLIDGTVRMLFLRLRFDEQLNYSVGMSDSHAPDQFGDFEPELSMTNASSELRINDGGTYDVLTVLQPGVWYNVWLLIDNVADNTQVWIHARGTEPALAADQLALGDQTQFAFRGDTAGDLQTFFIKTGGGSGVLGPLYLDAIYLEETSDLNLTNPAGPSATAVATPVLVTAFGIHPNPCNPRTTVTFVLADQQPVGVTVHDLAGRTVATLAAGILAPGTHALAWNGQDTAGRKLPSGNYVVRLATPAEMQARKVMLVR